jgi:hypothetical protein
MSNQIASKKMTIDTIKCRELIKQNRKKGIFVKFQMQAMGLNGTPKFLRDTSRHRHVTTKYAQQLIDGLGPSIFVADDSMTKMKIDLTMVRKIMYSAKKSMGLSLVSQSKEMGFNGAYEIPGFFTKKKFIFTYHWREMVRCLGESILL